MRFPGEVAARNVTTRDFKSYVTVSPHGIPTRLEPQDFVRIHEHDLRDILNSASPASDMASTSAACAD